MEHIHGCSVKELEFKFPCLVSDLDTISKCKRDWFEYPNDRDFDFERLRFHQWEFFPERKLAIFLQDWLFFGLLRALLPKEIEVRVDDFVIMNGQRERYITMQNLEDRYLKPWEKILSELSEDEMKEFAKENQRVLFEARKLCYHLSELPTAPGLNVFPPLPLECVEPCAILGVALSIARDSPMIGDAYCLPWTTGHLITEQMELQGW